LRAKTIFLYPALISILAGGLAYGQQSPLVRITIEQAIEMALKRNHNLLAARTNVQQNQAQEITANIRPNPTLFGAWSYLPLYRPEEGFLTYFHDTTEKDIGISYLFERGQKRQNRVQAAKDATEVSRSQVADNERTLGFQVASLFINVQLAEATMDFADQDLKSFQKTVEIAKSQFEFGGISENDNLKIKLQTLQFQQTLQQARLAKIQALSDLRQAVGYESIPANYDVDGKFEYRAFPLSLTSLEMKAIESRPDLRVAVQSITAAQSQYSLARANGKQDVTASVNYSNVGSNAVSFSFSVPLPIFDRNQGEIARTRYAMTQAQEQKKSAEGQVLTDVREAYEGMMTNDSLVQVFLSGNLETSKKSRDISEYAYQHGGATLLDFLDAERSYRATQVGYLQTLAAYLTSIEQVRQAAGTRSLP
jgi:cobalt-zinc-cadmium efflux system outer membrane protein